MHSEHPVRPNPALWIWYAFGGKLPDRHAAWVLHDVTARTWMLRHLLRSLVQVSPGLLFLLAPGPLWIKAMALLGGTIMALWFSAAYAEHTCEYRLAKHGYALGTGQATRKAAREAMDPERRARYNAIYRNGETD